MRDPSLQESIGRDCSSGQTGSRERWLYYTNRLRILGFYYHYWEYRDGVQPAKRAIRYIIPRFFFRKSLYSQTRGGRDFLIQSISNLITFSRRIAKIDKIGFFFFVRSLENSANNSDSIYDWTILLFGYRVPAGEKEKKSTVSIIQTKPSETKEKVAPAIQPSKTYKTNTEEETKKQVKGTKVVVNSVIEQNVINSSEDNGSRSVKDQVRLI